MLANKHNSQVKRDYIAPWMALFRLSHDDREVYQKDVLEMKQSLSELMDRPFLEPIDTQLAVLCIQTAYAATIKLTAYRVLKQKQGEDLDFQALRECSNEDLYN